ncbi:DUF1993 domain-containing protein [Pandoraea pulmonicola]|uniref:Uncharacterized protein conserved in bacteria n=1 Tax=Pandoraea pulmonicola TaxID=93221 RepID=A0AAJ5D0V5_PANPU|nr:DUF1993 domain-containing protein [Pandoraea pulmonicola]AJC20539.1 hypothetical protein RO07_08740 [Pandoraea pulmonicola]SUA91024.1 Uncharacterized protein conserved in bacteria [Pandoraea pulmonicola]
MTLTEILKPTTSQMMRALSAWLDKAARYEKSKGGTPDRLMTLRLAPDMYPLAAQVRFVSYQAMEPAFRLRGEAIPDDVLAVQSEGWRASEKPGTFAEAKACLANAIAFVDALPANALDAGADKVVSLALPNGVIFDMTGEQYVRDWLLAQFYFHTNTAYAILRQHGVELGKADYVAHVLPYMRSGSAPQG